MSPLLKRELLVWLVAAVLIAGYILLGRWLAPDVPPAPEQSEPDVVNIRGLEELAKKLKADRERSEAKFERQRFLLKWYQWGAGVGLVLIFVYSWFRPPWRVPAEGDAVDASPRSRPGGVARADFWDRLPISRSALLMLLATVVLLAVLVAVLMRGFR